MNPRRSNKLTPWRVGRRNPLNVYEGDQGADEDRSICQTHRPEDAQLIVDAVNALIDIYACLRCSAAAHADHWNTRPVEDRLRQALQQIVDECDDNRIAAIAAEALEPGEMR